MTEQQRAIVASTVGAVAGGLAGYMLFSDHGRILRRRLEPAIEDVVRELVQMRGTVNRVMGVASEGWSVLNEALGEGGTGGGTINYRQSSPF